MRNVNYKVNKSVVKKVDISITREELLRITEDKTSRVIICEIGIFGEEGIVDSKQVVINGDHYNLLMSNNPVFAPNKPFNEYREIDLWKIIDDVIADTNS